MKGDWRAKGVPDWISLLITRNSRFEEELDDSRKGNKPGALECATRGKICWAAAGAGNGAEFIAHSFQLLDEIGTKASPPKWLGHVPVDVSVRTVVVE